MLLRVNIGKVDGKVSTSDPELWLSTSGPIGVETLVRLMTRALRDAQHDYSERVAGLVLAIYAANSPSEDRCADGLSRFLEQVVDATVEIHFVIPALEEITANFTIGSFQFERTDLHRLKDLCARIGCDYASRYESQLKGTQTIRAAPIPCRLIAKSALLGDTPLRYRVYDDYMGAISQGLREAAARTYTEQTALMSISHEWMFPLERVLRVAPFPVIALFREREHPNTRGWVVPTRSGVGLVQSTDFWPAGAETAALWSTSLVSSLSPRDDLAGWIQGPSRLVIAAMAHRDAAEWDLAGLIATTAIELVLCESNVDLQKTLCRLGSCVCRHGLPDARHLSEERIRNLYDVRSKFVHQGKPIQQSDASDLVLLARVVVLTAVRAAALLEHPRAFDHTDWLRKVEAIRSIEAAGLSSDSVLLRAAGLIE
jgi:hypothetical protein